MMTKIPLNPDDEVKPGDKLELVFQLYGPTWLAAAQYAIIDDRLKKKYDNFKILNYSWDQDAGLLTVNVEVINPADLPPETQYAGVGETIKVVAICVAVLGTALVYLFTIKSTNKLVSTAAPAISAVAIAVIAGFVLKLVGKGAFVK